MKIPFIKLKVRRWRLPCFKFNKARCLIYPVCKHKETVHCTPLYNYLLPLYSDIDIYDIQKDFWKPLQKVFPNIHGYSSDR